MHRKNSHGRNDDLCFKEDACTASAWRRGRILVEAGLLLLKSDECNMGIP